MRLLIAVPLLALAAGCNVSKDGNAVTVQYDENTAENALADVSNTAENVADDIGNDLAATGDRIENRVGNTDVDVDVNSDVETENKQ